MRRLDCKFDIFVKTFPVEVQLSTCWLHKHQIQKNLRLSAYRLYTKEFS